MTKPLYKLTPDHEAQLKPWADKWIANAVFLAGFRFEPISVVWGG